jgi:MoaA/NifB/PqqE/SkfB family radical SAM enzyme
MRMQKPNEPFTPQLEAKGRNKIATSRPKEAWLALTGRCNLACLHCPRDPETASNENLSDSVLRQVFEDVFPYLDTVLLGGNNLAEQFISRAAEEVVDEAIRQGIKISVTTNASVVRPKLIQQLVAAGAEFRLSMEGTQDSWENIRGTRWSTFQKFLSEIEKARAASASECTVTIGFTAFANNIQCLPDVIRFAKEIRACRVHVQHLLPVHPNQRFQSLSYHRTAANRIFDDSDKLATELGVLLQLPARFPVGSMEKTDEPEPRSRKQELTPCYYPWTAVNILESGDVTPCCISNAMIMGNLKKQSFADIWNGKAYQRLRARVNTKPYGACKNCGMRGGGNNNPDVLLNLIDNDSMISNMTRNMKRFFIKRSRKDTVKKLVKTRDISVRLWNTYRNNSRLIFGDIAKGIRSTLSNGKSINRHDRAWATRFNSFLRRHSKS